MFGLERLEELVFDNPNHLHVLIITKNSQVKIGQGARQFGGGGGAKCPQPP